MTKISLLLRIARLNSNEFLAASPCSIFCYRTKTTNGTKPTKIQPSSSSSSDSSDDEVSKKKSKKVDSLNKLNLLLQNMINDDVVNNKSTIKLAQPTSKRGKTDINQKVEPELSEEQRLTNAAKKVAETFGGDIKQTESELLQKLLRPVDTDEQAKNLSDVIKGMKIDREPKTQTSRAEQVKKILQKFSPGKHERSPQVQRTQKRVAPTKVTPVTSEKIDLFGGEPLGIFTNKSNLSDGPKNDIWRTLENRDLKLAVTQPPSNYFQQMILWTEQGKLWKFPIDNEQGIEEESKVFFSEHVFLEEHLEPWCPPKGPVRHFMELVCVGLSKNPYLTVKDKKEHIQWYQNYFEDKRKLLQEVGALPPSSEGAGPQQKRLEK